MIVNSAQVRLNFGLKGSGLWFDIQPVSAGVFGFAAGILVTILVSLFTRDHADAPLPKRIYMDGI
jgi:cation/acetate symporter